MKCVAHLPLNISHSKESIWIFIYSKTFLKAGKTFLSLFESLNPDLGAGLAGVGRPLAAGCEWTHHLPRASWETESLQRALGLPRSLLPMGHVWNTHPTLLSMWRSAWLQSELLWAPPRWLSFSPASKASFSLQENTCSLKQVTSKQVKYKSVKLLLSQAKYIFLNFKVKNRLYF